MYTQLGVLTKGTIIEVRLSVSLGLIRGLRHEFAMLILRSTGQCFRIGNGDCRRKSRVGQMGSGHGQQSSKSQRVALTDGAQNNPEMDGCLNAVLLV